MDDLRAYAPSMERLSGIFALASLVPVIFATRLDWRSQSRADMKRAAEGKSKEDAQKEAKQDEEEEEERSRGIGIPCILLLAAAEVLGSLDVFTPALPKAAAKGKAKGVVAAAGFEAVLKGLEKGKKAMKPGAGSVDNAIAYIVALLESPEAFNAVRCIATTTACAIVLFSMFFKILPSLPSHLRNLRSNGRRTVLAVVGIGWPIFMFVWFQKGLFLKVSKALAGEQLLPTLRLPCRALALIFAALPGEQARGGSPATFVALQVGSLAATVSAQLVEGEFHNALALFKKSPVQDAIIDPSLHVFLVPTMLVILWLLGWHLQKNISNLALASMLSCASSPLALAKGWPLVCDALGVHGGTTKVAVANLIRMSSITFSATGISLVLASGTQGILACMVMLQVLLRIHGHEPFAFAFGLS